MCFGRWNRADNHFLMKKSQLIESTGMGTTLGFDNIGSNPSGLKKTMRPWQPKYSTMWLIVFRKDYEIKELSLSQFSLLIISIFHLWVCSGLAIVFPTDRYFWQGKCKRTLPGIFNDPWLKWLWKHKYVFFLLFDKKIYTFAVTFIKRSFCIHFNIKRVQIVCLYSMTFSEHKIYYNYLVIAVITIY